MAWTKKTNIKGEQGRAGTRSTEIFFNNSSGELDGDLKIAPDGTLYACNIPVNLLSYGPAEGNGLTATVNTDGSLHVTGTAVRQWAGLVWRFPCPVQGTVILSSPTFIAGLSSTVKFIDAKGHQLEGQVITDNNAVAIPAGTVSLRFEILSNEATPTAKDGDIRVQLESGNTAHSWMRPDNTSLKGGPISEPVSAYYRLA